MSWREIHSRLFRRTKKLQVGCLTQKGNRNSLGGLKGRQEHAKALQQRGEGLLVRPAKVSADHRRPLPLSRVSLESTGLTWGSSCLSSPTPGLSSERPVYPVG